MLKSFVALILLACASLSASAQVAPAFLAKDQVTETLGGKAFIFTRLTDSAKIRWEFKSDGTIYANNRSSTKKDSGEWGVQDNGSVCVRWRGSSNDSCNWYFMREGQLMRSGGRSDESVAKAAAMLPD